MLKKMSLVPLETYTRIDISRAFIYFVAFLTLTPLTLAVSFFALFTLNNPSPTPPSVLISQTRELPRFGARVYAALPQPQATVYGEAIGEDARVEIIRQYLEKYQSALTPHANLIVVVSDEYGLDSRLLVAIAQQESNLCKKIPVDSHNCWGYGIHSQGTLKFPDYPTAIRTVAKGLREDYADKGYDTPERIMKKYTPLSNGSWAAAVNKFLAEME